MKLIFLTVFASYPTSLEENSTQNFGCTSTIHIRVCVCMYIHIRMYMCAFIFFSKEIMGDGVMDVCAGAKNVTTQIYEFHLSKLNSHTVWSLDL